MWLLNHIRQKISSNKTIFFIILVILVSGISLIGVFHKGFFVSDDGNWMIIRFSAFYEAFRSGQFPVRFLPRLNNGYGYPVADFLYPLFMYIAVPIKVAGFSFVSSIKIVLGLSFIFSGIFSFLWLRKLFSNIAASVGAIAYVLFPYHLWDLYTRGSVGEILALAIVPFIFWQIERRSVPLIALGIASLIVAHNTLALLFLLFIFLYLYLRKFSLQSIVSVALLALMLSAFFWVPALLDKKYTVFDTIQVSDFNKFFISLNSLYLFGFISLLVFLQILYRVFKKNLNVLDIFFVITIFMVSLLTIPFSKLIWNFLPITQFIQFPFRLLSIVILGVSFLTASNIESLKKQKFLPVVYIIIMLVSATPFLTKINYTEFPDSFYSTNQDSTTVKNEYMPVWVKKQIPFTSQKVAVINGDGIINNITTKGTKIAFSTSFVSKATVRVNYIYFPGWKASADGISLPIYHLNPYGFVDIVVPSGVHTVSLYFGESIERQVADTVSLLGIIIFAGIFIQGKFYEKKLTH